MSDNGSGTAGAGTLALAGKNCVVMGIQNRWSIAYAIAEQMAAAGANIAESSTPRAYFAARRSASAASVIEPTTARRSSRVGRVRSAT